jgi:hypothetical protein
VKIRRTTLTMKEKLDIINRHEKGGRIVDICRNVTFVHIGLRTIRGNADKFTESGKSGPKVSV